MDTKATERMSGSLPIWIIYDRPKDFPSNTVARLFINGQPTDKVMIGNLETFRRYFAEQGLACLTRHPNDPEKIIEVWL